MSDRVEAYATAIFEVANAEGNLEQVEDELFQISRSIETSDALRSTLTDAAIPTEKRQAIVEDLVGQKALPLTTALVSFVVGAGRARDLPAIIKKLVEKAAEQRSQAVAEVRTATSLNDEQKKNLAKALEKATGKKISLKVVVDPAVLGGVVAKIGDTVIDGTVRNRIIQLKEAL